MNMETINSNILENYIMWEFEESNLVQYKEDPDFKQDIEMNDGVPIHHTREIQVQVLPPTKAPLSIITNLPERPSILPPLQYSSPSQHLVETNSLKAPIVMATAPSLRALPPWSPIEVSQRSKGANQYFSLCRSGRLHAECAKIDPPDDPLCTVSANGRQHITMHYMHGNRVPEEATVNPEKNTNITSQKLVSVVTKTRPKHWTENEDQILAIAVESQTQPCNWDLVASKFFPGSRTGKQCKCRWRRYSSTCGTIRGRWKPEEDETIFEMRSAGFSFLEISKQFQNRSHEQVRSRYNDHLDPSLVKTPWTEAEDTILIEEQSRIGNKWAQIAEALPGRSTNQVKNRWYQQHQEPRPKNHIKSPKVEQLNRSCEQIRSRHNDHLDPSLVKTRWTEAEDAILIEEQSRIGNKWAQIAKRLPGRSASQVKNRWYKQHQEPRPKNHTKSAKVKQFESPAVTHEEARPVEQIKSPTAKRTIGDSPKPNAVKTRCAATPWTEAEDTILIEEQSRIGNKWTQIAKSLPGRSTNQVKNRWYNRHQEPRPQNHIKSPKVDQFKPPTVTHQEARLVEQKIKSPMVKRERGDSPKPNAAKTRRTATPWTVDEDNILIQEQRRVGKKWKQISQLLPGRNSCQVRGRWKRLPKTQETNQLDQSNDKVTNEA